MRAGGGGLATFAAAGGAARRISGCTGGFGAAVTAGFSGAAALGGGGARPADAGPETAGFGTPAGAAVPTAGLEPPTAPAGGGAAGGVAPGASFAFGRAAPGDTAALGAGGAPLAPGTGSVLVFGKAWFEGSALGAFAGSVAFGAPALLPPGTGAAVKPVFTAGLIAALGGTGNLPCWISVAFCATEGGNVGVAPPCPGPAVTAGATEVPLALRPSPPPATGGDGLLMTVLITVVLWMLAKMMLFGGGAT
jgi:hypothetical protein